uniref:Carbohydrate kinase FGGY C-terminal domain-containing protein n=1 Tax=Megaselia scalaris TaxID=36166 RepID=T1GAM5_MEGSC
MGVHVWPDFHGNRSPLSDPNLRGMICGLRLKSDQEELAVLYLATMQALAEICTLLDENEHIYTYLNKVLVQMAEDNNLEDVCFLTKDVHVWPDFHGNRSPLSDPNLRGMICGLRLKSDQEELAVLYLATMQALAMNPKQKKIWNKAHNRILDCKGRSNYHSLLFCGGLAKNSLYTQTHADICELPGVVPFEQEMVLVGAAVLGAYASKVYPSLENNS